ncbi:hypothetical protein GAYE_SCF72G6967 [Galdieria yellowstonensis]|uniref:Uncharacterized protein n=1 Tax=Galdieria yellowstonensis TaxID=3028027 RepID=A0AAV9INC8_9RHOD|nr:hypothetical protein GAYE_SCF72G6967 [Galdieria yellowstonensis]
MFSSTRCQHISSIDVESEEALQVAKECFRSFSHQVLLGLKFRKSPEEIQRQLWNTIALYSVTQSESEEETAVVASTSSPSGGPLVTDSLSRQAEESAAAPSYYPRSNTQRVSDEERANAASHLFHVLKSLQFRKFPSERIVAKVRKLAD